MVHFVTVYTIGYRRALPFETPKPINRMLRAGGVNESIYLLWCGTNDYCNVNVRECEADNLFWYAQKIIMCSE